MKWIEIEELANEGKKTGTFEVRNVLDKVSLGIIKWKANWRKYAFFPYPQTCYEQNCMKDISEFIEKETKEYKKNWYKS